MGSIILAWSGRCARDRQEQLLEFIAEIARLNDQYWTAYPEPLNAFSRMMNEQRSAGRPKVATIRHVDTEVVGRVLVGGDVLDDYDAVCALEENGLAFHRDPSRPRTGFFEFERAVLKGIDFRLFDPYGRYPGSDRLSFVFLRAPEYPALDGRLVQYNDADACKAAPNSKIAGADAYLECPFVHLRYNHEAWLDSLMMWLKHYFVRDLRYESNRSHLGGEGFRVPGYVAMEETCGPALALKLSFEELCGEFNRECLEAAGQSRAIDT